MGCDIHSICEVQDGAGVWAPIRRGGYRRGYRVAGLFGSSVWNPYHFRNYDVFAILADVRNGSDFAGVIAGGGFIPIDKPRGVPSDASRYWHNTVGHWGSNGHSHSYFTLRELNNYDYARVIFKRGVVGGVEYARFKKEGRPNSYSAGVFGGGTIIVSNEEMDKVLADRSALLPIAIKHIGGLVQKLDRQETAHASRMINLHERLTCKRTARKALKDIDVYTYVRWETTYREAAGIDYFNMLEAMGEVAPGSGDPDCIRMLFFFDN